MNLNKWQRGALLAAAGLIVIVQLDQFSGRGVRGSGWVLAFAVAGGLAFLALSSSAKKESDQEKATLGIGPKAGVKEAQPPGTEPPTTQGTDAEGPKPVFGKANAERFLEVTQELAAGTLRPWLYQKLGRGNDGRMLSGVRMVSKNKETGQEIDMDALLIGHMEEVTLSYCFGVASFASLIHKIRWDKSAGCKDVSARFSMLLQAGMEKQNMPGLVLTAERRAAVANQLIEGLVNHAGMCAFGFWKEHIEDGHQLLQSVMTGKGHVPNKKVASGLEKFHRWMDTPSDTAGNPLGFLEGELADKLGFEYRGKEWESKLEAEYGEITRRLIRRAIDMLNVEPASKPADEKSAKEALPPEVRAIFDQMTGATPGGMPGLPCVMCGGPRTASEGLQCRSCTDFMKANANNSIHACGGCGAGFLVGPNVNVFTFTADGTDRVFCACCQEYVRENHSTGGMPPMAPAYDIEGQSIMAKHPGMPPGDTLRLRNHQVQLQKLTKNKAKRTGVAVPPPVFTMLPSLADPRSLSWCRTCHFFRESPEYQEMTNGAWTFAKIPDDAVLPCKNLHATRSVWTNFYALEHDERTLFPKNCGQWTAR